MEKLAESITEQDWAAHVVRFENFKGSMAEYCRQNNLIYDSLRFRKLKREAEVRKAQPRPAFVKVESELPLAPKKKFSELPDPEWLAQLIRELQSTGR